jgi:hypothetical protein
VRKEVFEWIRMDRRPLSLEKEKPRKPQTVKDGKERDLWKAISLIKTMRL